MAGHVDAFERCFLKAALPALADELVFERAVQPYIWALPALNMYAMKEASEKVFGKDYDVLPICKDVLKNAKTLITMPNADVICRSSSEVPCACQALDLHDRNAIASRIETSYGRGQSRWTHEIV